MATRIPKAVRKFFDEVADAAQDRYDSAMTYAEHTGLDDPGRILDFGAYDLTLAYGGNWAHTGGNIYVGYIPVPGQPDWVVAIGEESVCLHNRNRDILHREGIDPGTRVPEEIAIGDPDGTLDRYIG